MAELCRCVVLVSGSGTNLQALVEAASSGWLRTEIAAVISNRPDAPALERAAQARIPRYAFDHTDYPDRSSFDTALTEAVTSYTPDLVVLAGFMRLLTKEFVTHWWGRLINLHPSLLPAFRGLRTHERVLEAGCKIHGTTAHFVTAETDSGPIIAQAALPIHPDETPTSLAERLKALEHRLLPQVVRWFAEGRLQLREGRVYLQGGHVSQRELIAPPLELE